MEEIEIYFYIDEINEIFDFLLKKKFDWFYPSATDIKDINELKNYLNSLNQSGAILVLENKHVTAWDFLYNKEDETIHWLKYKKILRLKKMKRLVND